MLLNKVDCDSSIILNKRDQRGGLKKKPNNLFCVTKKRRRVLQFVISQNKWQHFFNMLLFCSIRRTVSCPSYSLLGRPLPSLVLPLFNSIKPPLFIWLEFHLIQSNTFGIYFVNTGVLKMLKWARLTLKEHIWEWGDQWRGNMTSNCQIEALHLHLHLMPCVVCFSLFSFLPLFTLCGSSSPFFGLAEEEFCWFRFWVARRNKAQLYQQN